MPGPTGCDGSAEWEPATVPLLGGAARRATLHLREGPALNRVFIGGPSKPTLWRRGPGGTCSGDMGAVSLEPRASQTLSYSTGAAPLLSPVRAVGPRPLLSAAGFR